MRNSFSDTNNSELLRMEFILQDELDHKLRNMVLDDEMNVIYSKLEEIAKEKKERDL